MSLSCLNSGGYGNGRPGYTGRTWRQAHVDVVLALGICVCCNECLTRVFSCSIRTERRGMDKVTGVIWLFPGPIGMATIRYVTNISLAYVNLFLLPQKVKCNYNRSLHIMNWVDIMPAKKENYNYACKIYYYSSICYVKMRMYRAQERYSPWVGKETYVNCYINRNKSAISCALRSIWWLRICWKGTTMKPSSIWASRSEIPSCSSAGKVDVRSASKTPCSLRGDKVSWTVFSRSEGLYCTFFRCLVFDLNFFGLPSVDGVKTNRRDSVQLQSPYYLVSNHLWSDYLSSMRKMMVHTLYQYSYSIE